MPADYATLPFDEAIRFFRQKTNLNTSAWTDIWQEAHDKSFVVAGAARDELVADFRAAIDQAISEGTGLKAFQQQFDDIVAKHGWSYKGGRGWRTRVIYQTNMQTAYQAGRYAQLTDPDLLKLRPYWQYKHSDFVADPRLEHVAWSGTVLRADDPWWKTHYPPNGWGCRCTVVAIGKRQLARMGKDGPDQAPPIEWEDKTVGTRGPSPRTVRVPKGIDPGWAYTPGRSWVEGVTPPPLPGGLLPIIPFAGMPPLEPLDPRPVSSDRLLADDLDDQAYIDAFLSEFGVRAPDRWTYYQDVAGEMLVISDALFRERDGSLKVGKRGRAPYVRLLADTIKDPDEIREAWAEWGDRRVLRRRYVARWQIDGTDVPLVTVFETGPQGWVGVTAHSVRTAAQLDQRSRRGAALIYRRRKK